MVYNILGNFFKQFQDATLIIIVAVVSVKRLTVLMEAVSVEVYFYTMACKKVSFIFELF